MAMIIRLQNLSWNAQAADIRRFFSGLFIPEGGVHIVGGEFGDAFITFGSEDDARLALRLAGQQLCGEVVKLFVSSTGEMQQVVARAKQAAAAAAAAAAAPVAPPPKQTATVPAGLPVAQPSNSAVPQQQPPTRQLDLQHLASQLHQSRPPRELPVGGYPPEKRRREAVDSSLGYADYGHETGEVGTVESNFYDKPASQYATDQSAYRRNGEEAYGGDGQRYQQPAAMMPSHPGADGNRFPSGSGDRFPPGPGDRYPSGRQPRADAPQVRSDLISADSRESFDRFPNSQQHQNQPYGRDQPVFRSVPQQEPFQQPQDAQRVNPELNNVSVTPREQAYVDSQAWSSSADNRSSFREDDGSFHQQSQISAEISNRRVGIDTRIDTSQPVDQNSLTGRGNQLNFSEGLGSGRPGFGAGRGGSGPGFEGRGGSRPGFEGRGGIRPGFEGRGGSRPGFEGRGGIRPGFEGRGGSRPGFESRGGSRPGFEGRGGIRPGFEGRGGIRPGFEGRGASRPNFAEGRGGGPTRFEGRVPGNRLGFEQGRVGDRHGFGQGRTSSQPGFSESGIEGQSALNDELINQPDMIEARGESFGSAEERGSDRLVFTAERNDVQKVFSESLGGGHSDYEGLGGGHPYVEGLGGGHPYVEGRSGQPGFAEARGGPPSFAEGRGGRPSFVEGRGGRPGFAEGRGGRPGFAEGRGSQAGFAEGRGGRSGFAEGRGGRPGFAEGRGGGGRPGFAEGRGGQAGFADGRGGRPGFSEGRGGRRGFTEGQSGRPGFFEGRGGRPGFTEGQSGRPGFAGRPEERDRGFPDFAERIDRPDFNEGFAERRGAQSAFDEKLSDGQSEFSQVQINHSPAKNALASDSPNLNQAAGQITNELGYGAGFSSERRAAKSTSLLERPGSQSGDLRGRTGQNLDVRSNQNPDALSNRVSSGRGGHFGLLEGRAGPSRFSGEMQDVPPERDIIGRNSQHLQGFLNTQDMQTEDVNARRENQPSRDLPGVQAGHAAAERNLQRPNQSNAQAALLMYPQQRFSGPPAHPMMRAPVPPRPQAPVVPPNLRSPTPPRPATVSSSEVVAPPSADSVSSRGRGIGFRRSRFDSAEETASVEMRPANEAANVPPLLQAPGSGRGIAFSLNRSRMTAIGAGIRPPEPMHPPPQRQQQPQPPLTSETSVEDSISMGIRSIRNSGDSASKAAPAALTGLFRPRPWETASCSRFAPSFSGPTPPEPKPIKQADNQPSIKVSDAKNSASTILPSLPQLKFQSQQDGSNSATALSSIDSSALNEVPEVSSNFSFGSIKYIRGSNDAHYLALRDVPLDARYNNIVGALPAGVRLSHSAIKYEADSLRRRTGQAFIRLADVADQRRCLASPKSASGIHVRQSCEHEFISANDPTLSDSKLLAEIGGPLPTYPPCPSPYHDDCCLEISGLPKPVVRDDLVSIFGQSAITDPLKDIFIDQSKCPLTATAYVHLSLYSEFQTALSTDASKSFPGASVCAISMIQFREYANISQKAAITPLADLSFDFRLTRDQRLAASSGGTTVVNTGVRSDLIADDSKQVCVEVLNLPMDATTKELREFFHPFSIERDAIQLIVRDTSLQAFVQFVEPKVASDAVSANNGRRLRGCSLTLRLRTLGQRREALAALASGIAAAAYPGTVDDKADRSSLTGSDARKRSSASSSPSSKSSRKRSRRRSRGRRDKRR